jgi:hypothetical protein
VKALRGRAQVEREEGLAKHFLALGEWRGRYQPLRRINQFKQ